MLKLPSDHRLRSGTINTFRGIMLVVNPLVWYSTIIIFLQNFLSQQVTNGILTNSDAILIWALHFSGIIFSAIIGSSLTKKFETNRFLLGWMIIGTFSSLSLFAVGTSSMVVLGFIVVLLGVSLGLGMPACMEYFTESLPIENRGKLSGVIMLATGIGAFLATGFMPSSALIVCLILVLWRSVSILVFYPMRTTKLITTDQKQIPTYKYMLTQRSFIFYLIPWVMFSLVNFLYGTAQQQILGSAYVGISLVQSVMLAAFAVIGGFLLDIIGRKRIAISGFILLGIDSAILGLFPKDVLANYVAGVINGISWGFLLSIFIVVIWGDLSQSQRSAKYYAIGVTPFFVSKFLALTSGTAMANFILDNPATGGSGLFSFLAFFLFIAVLPLVYAPETLPEKTMKDRDLKSYAEKAMQKVKREDEKSKKFFPNKPRENKLEFEVNLKDNIDPYEKQKQLAEKYY